MIICKKCNALLPEVAQFCYLCGAAVNEQKKPSKSRKHKKRPNGSGTVYKLPNGKYRAKVVLYYFVNKDGNRQAKFKTKSCDTYAEAYAALSTLKAAETHAETLNDLHEIFTSSKHYNGLSDNQVIRMKAAWKRLEPLHYVKIANLTVDMMQKTIDAAVSTYYPAKDMKTLLSHIYKLAAQRDIVRTNKTEYIELPDYQSPEKNTLTDEEIKALWNDWNTKRDDLTGYLLIMLYCGLRHGELESIEQDNIHLDDNYMIGGIKTKSGKNREIPICSKIKPVIAHFVGGGKFMRIDDTSFYDNYRAVFDRCGIRKEVVPHSLRHTFFSLLAADSTISGAVISATGGHSRYSTTVDNYVKIPLSEKLAAVNKLK